MRKISTLHVFEFARLPTEVVANVTVAGGVGAALDWPVGAKIARLVGFTTAGLMMPFMFNPVSTQAALTGSSVFSSGTSQSSNANIGVLGELLTQVLGGSTGFSVISPVAGQINIEAWQV